MRNKEYFNQDNLPSLRLIAESWMGTPRKENHAIKGVGIGCASLIHQINLEHGAFKKEDMDIPHGYSKWSLYHQESLMDKFFAEARTKKRVVRLDEDEPNKIGDLIVFADPRRNRPNHHIGQIYRKALEDFIVIHVGEKTVTRVSLDRVREFVKHKYRIYQDA